MNNLKSQNNSLKVAYTVTGDIANVLRAVNRIKQTLSKQEVTEPVDLWILQTNPKLHERLEAESNIRKVFVSPVKERAFSNPDPLAPAIPVYGQYNDVIHLGAEVDWW